MKDSISIEINDKFTRMCDASVINDKIELLSLGVKETSPLFFSSNNDVTVEKQADIISRLYSSLKLTQKNARVVIPDSYTYSQIAEMPKLKEKELLAAIKYQADEFIPMPINETSLDLEVIMEDDVSKKTLLLIVASPKALVSTIEKTIVKAGLIPYSLENELSVIARMYSEFLKPQGKGNMIINFGLSTTSIYVFDGVKNLLRLSRTFNIGLNLFVKDLSINMNWDDLKTAEALRTIGLAENASYNISEIISPLLTELFNEVEKLLTLAKDRHAIVIDSIHICNFEGAIAHLPEALEKRFNIKTSQVKLDGRLTPNQVSTAFAKDLSSFISVISANI